jgi:hypothetical protein
LKTFLEAGKIELQTFLFWRTDMKSCAAYALLFMGLLFSDLSVARDEKEILRDAVKAAKQAVGTYKNEGVSGMIIAIEECYKKQKKKATPYCMYLDLASARTDQIYSEAIKAPRHEFFAVENFVMRADTVLARTTVPFEARAEYLKDIITLMTQVTDKEILKGYK